MKRNEKERKKSTNKIPAQKEECSSVDQSGAHCYLWDGCWCRRSWGYSPGQTRHCPDIAVLMATGMELDLKHEGFMERNTSGGSSLGSGGHLDLTPLYTYSTR